MLCLHVTGSKLIWSENLTRSALCLYLLGTPSGTGQWNRSKREWKLDLQNSNLDPFWSGSRILVPCKNLDQFQMVPCKQKMIWSGLVQNSSISADPICKSSTDNKPSFWSKKFTKNETAGWLIDFRVRMFLKGTTRKWTHEHTKYSMEIFYGVHFPQRWNLRSLWPGFYKKLSTVSTFLFTLPCAQISCSSIASLSPWSCTSLKPL